VASGRGEHQTPTTLRVAVDYRRRRGDRDGERRGEVKRGIPRGVASEGRSCQAIGLIACPSAPTICDRSPRRAGGRAVSLSPPLVRPVVDGVEEVRVGDRQVRSKAWVQEVRWTVRVRQRAALEGAGHCRPDAPRITDNARRRGGGGNGRQRTRGEE
jgi:hypothetical protein